MSTEEHKYFSAKYLSRILYIVNWSHSLDIVPSPNWTDFHLVTRISMFDCGPAGPELRGLDLASTSHCSHLDIIWSKTAAHCSRLQHIASEYCSTFLKYCNILFQCNLVRPCTAANFSNLIWNKTSAHYSHLQYLASVMCTAVHWSYFWVDLQEEVYFSIGEFWLKISTFYKILLIFWICQN